MKTRQFSVRALFLFTTIFAIIYGCLNWFGAMAHFAVWVTFLTAGPIVGIILGVKKLKETDPIVNAVQSGALGGAVGFAGAFLLLAPANISQSFATLSLVAVFGIQASFTAGGVLGFLAGIVLSLVPRQKR